MDNEQEKKHEYNNALNTYYKLKSAYENAYNTDKNRIIKMKNLSWKEKRIEFTKLKPKCINCKRAVGSLFYNSTDDGNRYLMAKCGDKSKPCPLNIVINVGYILNLKNELSVDEKNIANTKREIIMDKNNLLFGYITSKEAVEKFDTVKESFSSTSTNYEYLLQLYNTIVNNKDEKEELIKEQMNAQIMIDTMKRMMKDFERSQNVQFVNDVVEMYIKELMPRLNKIMKQKYAYSGVEYDEAANTYHLIQLPTTIETLEYDVATGEQGIVSLKMGMEQNPVTRRSSRKEKQPTRRSKPTLVIESEADASLEPDAVAVLEPDAVADLESDESSDEEED